VSQLASSRLPAAERRQALLDAALRVFSSGSYAGATTAEIAREAGVSEPILYRHFASKRELYLAVLESAWEEIRAGWDRIVTETDPADGWVSKMGKVALSAPGCRAVLADLWIQSLSEAYDDAEIRRYLRRQMREVHDFFAGLLQRMQACGAMPADRNVDAEAWILVAGSLLVSIADRLGGPLSAEDFAAIKAERKRWLTGAD